MCGALRLCVQPAADSNAAFDESLRSRSSDWGIRNFEAVNKLANTAGLALVARESMPANNFLCVWKKD